MDGNFTDSQGRKVEHFAEDQNLQLFALNKDWLTRLMNILFNSEVEGAPEMHDELVELGLTRLQDTFEGYLVLPEKE